MPNNPNYSVTSLLHGEGANLRGGLVTISHGPQKVSLQVILFWNLKFKLGKAKILRGVARRHKY